MAKEVKADSCVVFLKGDQGNQKQVRRSWERFFSREMKLMDYPMIKHFERFLQQGQNLGQNSVESRQAGKPNETEF